jgi:hypothetical protein
VHLAVVQSPHVVRLPAMLLLLLRFLTLLAFGDRGLRAPAGIRSERTLLVLFCRESLYFFAVFRVAAELTAQTFLFDDGLSILYAPQDRTDEVRDTEKDRVNKSRGTSSRFASSFARSASARNLGFSPIACSSPAASRC